MSDRIYSLQSAGAVDVPLKDAQILGEAFGRPDGGRAFLDAEQPLPDDHWAYQAEVLGDDPSYYWSFDATGSSLADLTDLSGPNRGTAGGSTYLYSANAGTAGGWNTDDGPTAFGETALVAANASNKYISPSSTVNIYNTATAFTQECWYLHGASSTVVGEMVWASSHGADGMPYFYANDDGTYLAFVFAPRGNAAGGVGWSGTRADWIANQWQWQHQGWNHLAMSWSGATKEARFYVNGQPINTQTAAVDISGSPTNGILLGEWYMGAHVWPMLTGSKIAEPAYYPYVLSDARILAHYEAR